jgi:hypothetical protein
MLRTDHDIIVRIGLILLILRLERKRFLIIARLFTDEVIEMVLCDPISEIYPSSTQFKTNRQ